MSRARATGLWLGLLPIAVRAQDSPSHQEAIALTMPSVVTVLAIDVRDGELELMAAGSGTIVQASGAVLTNHHVLYDARNTRLYDRLLVGRFRAAHRPPELVCAGVPADGLLRPDLDLALIRCDADLNGQPTWPQNWPAVPLGDSSAVVPGEPVWVLGYPSAAGGTIRVSAGLVSGWTGEHGGAAGRAFMRTDAAVSAGNSGGAAVDRYGRLIGVPTAFRVITAEGEKTTTALGKVGLIRPIELARELIEVGGGASSTATSSSAFVGPASRGGPLLVAGRVADASSLRPVVGAFVLAIDRSLAGDDVPGAGGGRVAAWARTDATGRFVLEPPLRRGRRYTVAATAPGYLPAMERDALEVPTEGAHALLPWRELKLVRRSAFGLSD